MECRLCSRRFSSNLSYFDHFILHKQERNTAYECGVLNCTHKFITLSGLKSHFYRIHSSLAVNQDEKHDIVAKE